jgi:hypothetical protein
MDRDRLVFRFRRPRPGALCDPSSLSTSRIIARTPVAMASSLVTTLGGPRREAVGGNDPAPARAPSFVSDSSLEREYRIAVLLAASRPCMRIRRIRSIRMINPIRWPLLPSMKVVKLPERRAHHANVLYNFLRPDHVLGDLDHHHRELVGAFQVRLKKVIVRIVQVA